MNKRLMLELVEQEIHDLETPYPDETTKARLIDLWDIKAELIDDLDE